MSNTLRFTPLHPLDAEHIDTSRNSHCGGVQITDLEGLEDALPDVLVDQMDTREYVDREEYPGREWEFLLGFTTWGADEDDPMGGADYHNVSNTGPEEMARTWATVSEYTEPFVVYQTRYNGHWPHAAELDEAEGHIYRVEAADGAVEMETLTVGIVDREGELSEGWDDGE